MQMIMRMEHGDGRSGLRSVEVVPSYRNQRIESWWGRQRIWHSQFWLDLFTQLQSEGYFVQDAPMYVAIMQFVFLPLMQTELEEFVRYWNHHRIRYVALPLSPILAHSFSHIVHFVASLMSISWAFVYVSRYCCL